MEKDGADPATKGGALDPCRKRCILYLWLGVSELFLFTFR